MPKQPFFSVIVPTYNRKPFLEKCVTSVLAQDYADFELIVIDDGSSDGTAEPFSGYDDPRLKYFYLEHKGVAAARNGGLAIARGEYIAFLDSDDRWKPEKLGIAARYIKNFPHIKIFHTEEVWYKNGRLLPQKKKHKKPEGNVFANALPLCCISISTAVMHRSVFEECGAFDESFEACEDYDLWLRVTAKHAVKLIPEELTLKDGGRPDQLSSSVWGLDRFRIKAIEKILLSGALSPENRSAALGELKKKCDIFAAGAKKRGRL